MWQHLIIVPLPPPALVPLDAREPVTALFGFALLTVLLLPLVIAASGRVDARSRVVARRGRWRPRALAHPRERPGLPVST